MAGGSPAPSQAGPTPNRLKRKAPASSAPAAAPATAAGEEEAEIEELETEVADLGRRILEHRRDAATRLLDAAASRLAALRPPTFPEVPQSVAGTSLAEADQEKLEKLKIFKSKSEANITAMPKVLKKINECVARMEKLEQLNIIRVPLTARYLRLEQEGLIGFSETDYVFN